MGDARLIASRAWRKWWSSSGKSQLRLMALEHWDPLNVYDTPEQADAYDAYLERVGRMLRKGKGSEELATYLGQVRTLAFKLDEAEITDELFADRVLAWYALECPD